MSSVLRFGIIGSNDEALLAYQAISAAGNAEVTILGGDDLGSLQGMEEVLSAHLAVDHNEVWQGGHVDAVYIASVAGDREDTVRQALEAGKHVLMAPPLALSPDEADALLDAASSSGRYLGLTYPWYADDALNNTRMLLRAGVYGEIIGWSVTRLYEEPFPDALTMATSELGLFYYLTGIEPVDVMARRSADASLVSLLVGYRDGCLGSCVVGAGFVGGAGRLSAGPRILCTEGQVDLSGEPESVHSRSTEDAPAREWQPVRHAGSRGDLQLLIEQFSGEVLAGSYDMAETRAMLGPLQIIEAARQSMVIGQPVTVAR